MEKLKTIVEQYNYWQALSIYLKRIEDYVEVDFSTTIENSKSLLETIAKEICKYYKVEINNDISVNALIKKAFTALGYSGALPIVKMSSSLATIGQCVGDVRNEVGSVSHGKSLEELRQINQQFDEITKNFLLDSTEIIACLLIGLFERGKKDDKTQHESSLIKYTECEAFNEFWDDVFEEIVFGNYTFLASEILYNMDYKSYQAELNAFDMEE